MIELLNINGTAISEIDYVEYLGTEFGSVEVVNFNGWGELSVSPMMMPIANHQNQTATVRFLIKGAPTQLAFEETITNIVMLFRGVANPTLNFNGFSFMGQCVDFSENRIIRSQVAEITLTLEGFKFVKETVEWDADSDELFTNVLIESPMIISFDATSTAGMIAGSSFATEIIGLQIGETYVWDGFNHTFTHDGENAIDKISRLVFPTASVGGSVISSTFDSLDITVYRRLL